MPNYTPQYPPSPLSGRAGSRPETVNELLLSWMRDRDYHTNRKVLVTRCPGPADVWLLHFEGATSPAGCVVYTRSGPYAHHLHDGRSRRLTEWELEIVEAHVAKHGGCA